jgi:hypothetical protein
MTATDKINSSTDFMKDLFNFMHEVKEPVKDTKNPFFNSKYAPLNSVLPDVKDVARKHNFMVVQRVTGGEGSVAVETVLMHKSGEFISSGTISMAIMMDKNGAITPQALGSTVTYLRRYQLYPFLGIAELDDDGNAGSHKEPEAKGKGKSKPEPAAEEPEYSDGLERVEFYEKEIAGAKKVDSLNDIWADIQNDDSIDEDAVKILKSALKNRKKEIEK